MNKQSLAVLALMAFALAFACFRCGSDAEGVDVDFTSATAEAVDRPGGLDSGVISIHSISLGSAVVKGSLRACGAAFTAVTGDCARFNFTAIDPAWTVGVGMITARIGSTDDGVTLDLDNQTLEFVFSNIPTASGLPLTVQTTAKLSVPGIGMLVPTVAPAATPTASPSAFPTASPTGSPFTQITPTPTATPDDWAACDVICSSLRDPCLEGCNGAASCESDCLSAYDECMTDCVAALAPTPTVSPTSTPKPTKTPTPTPTSTPPGVGRMNCTSSNKNIVNDTLAYIYAYCDTSYEYDILSFCNYACSSSPRTDDTCYCNCAQLSCL